MRIRMHTTAIFSMLRVLLLYLELMLQLLDGCWTHHTVPVVVVLHVELRLGERLHAQRLAQRLQHTSIFNKRANTTILHKLNTASMQHATIIQQANKCNLHKQA